MCTFKLLKMFPMTRRTRKYLKFTTHLLYIGLFSYFVSLSNVDFVVYRKIDRFTSDFRHILIWTEIPGVKYEGQKQFLDSKCEYINCYFTKNRSLFGDPRYFDAIVFNLQQVSLGAGDLPDQRGVNQKYIFAANNSADNYPVCDHEYDDFFNWTWTYRRDSTIRYKFFAIFTRNNQLLDEDINFRENMDALTTYQKSQMNSKYKAAATFLEKCKSRSKREDLIDALKTELNKFNLTVDVYGDCGPLKCKRKSMAACNYKLRKNYYFFLALEDSVALDYVTDVLLPAFTNDIVPVVYGGANYNEFLPRNSFLDVKSFENVSLLVQKMVNLMKHKDAYYEYFRWKNYYSFSKATVLSPCSLCEYLNKPSMLIKRYSLTNFRRWWNSQYDTRCLAKSFWE